MARQKKTTVMMVFGCRLPLIAITVLRLKYLTAGLRSSDPTLDDLPTVLATQVELGWSLISATVPCINPFIRAVSTRYGAMDSETMMDGNHMYDTRKPKGAHSSYGLRSIFSRKNALNFKQSEKPVTSVHSGRRESAAQEIIIHAEGKDYDRDARSPQIYRGDHSSNTARVFSEGRVDADSVDEESNDSTKMIIKKEVQWFVESDKNTVSTVNTGGASLEMADQTTKASTEL
ncbi:hypothetical protein EPUS_09109 [Endocarpon pusillum Z07020]|uniref:Rhodopsin domain-containing protein n=1 Tax=Endocarpon pusillum (strain Z07020 / HMAS-L-300199) TaxID=1263415 RepID=U1GEV9_ENDPU|nr:uncharacterized protein EPUS_09109 [Endocarpon pusillum Z07020]ERF70271.1 hypothetical protein EPUS_09109 [Endocarpon pusillum Z07020]